MFKICTKYNKTLQNEHHTHIVVVMRSLHELSSQPKGGKVFVRMSKAVDVKAS